MQLLATTHWTEQKCLKKDARMAQPSVITLHDNVTNHTAQMTEKWFKCYRWQALQHPQYSPNLATLTPFT